MFLLMHSSKFWLQPFFLKPKIRNTFLSKGHLMKSLFDIICLEHNWYACCWCKVQTLHGLETFYQLLLMRFSQKCFHRFPLKVFDGYHHILQRCIYHLQTNIFPNVDFIYFNIVINIVIKYIANMANIFHPTARKCNSCTDLCCCC